jgi:hypothetical protein
MTAQRHPCTIQDKQHQQARRGHESEGLPPGAPLQLCFQGVGTAQYVEPADTPRTVLGVSPARRLALDLYVRLTIIAQRHDTCPLPCPAASQPFLP